MKAILRGAMITVLGSAVFAAAQSSSPARPSPNAEMQQQLGYFVGTWKLTGETKASPFTPGGQKFDARETLEWMSGGFFLVARSYEGDRWVGVTIIGYDAPNKVFSHTSYDAHGDIEVMKGTARGDTFTWYRDRQIKGKPGKERMIIRKVSPELYTFKFEMAPEAGDWSLVYEGKGVKTP